MNQQSLPQQSTNSAQSTTNHVSAFRRQASLPFATGTDTNDGKMSADVEYECGYNEFASYLQSHPNDFTDEKSGGSFNNSSCSRPHQLHLSKSPSNEEVLVITTPEYVSKTSDSTIPNQYQISNHMASSVYDGRSPRIHSSTEEQGQTCVSRDHKLLLFISL